MNKTVYLWLALALCLSWTTAQDTDTSTDRMTRLPVSISYFPSRRDTPQPTLPDEVTNFVIYNFFFFFSGINPLIYIEGSISSSLHKKLPLRIASNPHLLFKRDERDLKEK